MCVFVCVYVSVCMWVWVYVPVYAHMCVCACPVCVCVGVCVDTVICKLIATAGCVIMLLTVSVPGTLPLPLPGCVSELESAPCGAACQHARIHTS